MYRARSTLLHFFSNGSEATQLTEMSGMLLLYVCFLSCSLCVALVTRKPIKTPSRIELDIASVMASGDELYNNGRFTDAGVCYSGSLQMLAGSTASSNIARRRLSGLRLALCELKNGQFQNALARCSEVIAETHEPVISMDQSETYSLTEPHQLSGEQLLARDLGLAYLTRAKCFIGIGKARLGKQDLKLAIKYIPDELEVYQLMYSAQEDDINEKPGINDSILNEHDEVIEDCILNHPSAEFSKKRLKTLIESCRHRTKSKSLNKNRGNPIITTAKYQSNGGNMGGRGLGALLQGLAPVGLGAVAAAHGGSARGNDIKLNNNQALISMAVPLLTGMMGMDAAASRNVVDIVNALSKAWTLLHRVYSVVQKYRDLAVSLLTIMWIVIASYNALIL